MVRPTTPNAKCLNVNSRRFENVGSTQENHKSEGIGNSGWQLCTYIGIGQVRTRETKCEQFSSGLLGPDAAPVLFPFALGSFSRQERGRDSRLEHVEMDCLLTAEQWSNFRCRMLSIRSGNTITPSPPKILDPRHLDDVQCVFRLVAFCLDPSLTTRKHGA